MTIKTWRREDLAKMLQLVEGAANFYRSVLNDMDELGLSELKMSGGHKDSKFLEACSDMLAKGCDEADIGIKAAALGNERLSWRSQYRDQNAAVDRKLGSLMEKVDATLRMYKKYSRPQGKSPEGFIEHVKKFLESDEVIEGENPQ